SLANDEEQSILSKSNEPLSHISTYLIQKQAVISKHLRRLGVARDTLRPNSSEFMNSEVLNRRRYRFGIFQLDTFSGELYKHGIRIKLQDQPCQVLTILLERDR